MMVLSSFSSFLIKNKADHLNGFYAIHWTTHHKPVIIS